MLMTKFKWPKGFFFFPYNSQENSQNAPLVHATLETLLRFLNWIPLGYIFETKLISTLVYKVRRDGDFLILTDFVKN